VSSFRLPAQVAICPTHAPVTSIYIAKLINFFYDDGLFFGYYCALKVAAT